MVSSTVLDERKDESTLRGDDHEPPTDMPTVVDFAGAILGRDIEFCRSGYMADSEDEGVYKWSLQSKKSSFDGYQLSKSLTTPHMNGTKKRGHGSSLSRQSKRRRISSAETSSDDNTPTWIQRIYNHTPYSVACIAEKTRPDDYSWVTSETIEKTAKEQRKVLERYQKGSPLISKGMMLSTSPRSSIIDGHPIISFHGDSDTTETTTASNDSSDDMDSDAVDEEMEEALLNTVSDLLHECQEVQARYRSYSQLEESNA